MSFVAGNPLGWRCQFAALAFTPSARPRGFPRAARAFPAIRRRFSGPDRPRYSLYRCRSHWRSAILREIAENLHRAEQIAEWIKLTEETTAGASCAGSLSDGRKAGPQHQPHGINAAVRELSIERTEAQRAVKIAEMESEAKEEAKVLHLDDNQRALLNAAKQPTKEQQIRTLQEHAAKRAGPVSAGDATASESRGKRPDFRDMMPSRKRSRDSADGNRATDDF